MKRPGETQLKHRRAVDSSRCTSPTSGGPEITDKASSAALPTVQLWGFRHLDDPMFEQTCMVTSAQQSRALTRISSTYQNEVDKALNGNYSADLEALSPLKLRMHLRQYADDFAKSMAIDGHAKVFRTIRGENDPEFLRLADDSDDIYDWIRRYYLESRGSELPGTVNQIVLQNIFRQQFSPWEKIAIKYL
ncbi:hypothetical protein N7510_011817 [Penicillium lagena]|uniref:uncharacterized protein n=1 Tax=Penicillium lagena TaxID=94218 RepID=UPI0025419D6C|nr:uncharacterized protein N7510_011817 [Penicillium lagena]KAJ5602283.1 hypothetical protein N7510_011817 [Penicillium lagena]